MCGGDHLQILPLTVKTMGLNFPRNKNMEHKSLRIFSPFIWHTDSIYQPVAEIHLLSSPDLTAKAEEKPYFESQQNNNACLWRADCVTEQCSSVKGESSRKSSKSKLRGKVWELVEKETCCL